MPRMKGADLISDFLIQERVPYVFGICGHGNVGLLDALWERQDKIKLISPRHEQTAGHMADAYYRVAHKPVATLTSCGPGSCNLVMATACASADSSAVPSTRESKYSGSRAVMLATLMPTAAVSRSV